MIELRSDNYYKVVPLINKIPFNNLFARVVVENKVKGKIFVDDDINPTVCLVIHRYGMSLLCGNYRNSLFNNSLVSFLKNNSENNNTAKWMLTYPENWEGTLASLLRNDLIKVTDDTDSNHFKKNREYVLQTERTNFNFDKNLFLDNRKTPEGFLLKRVDFEIFEIISGSVVPRYFWNSAEDFLKNGIGFSLVHNNQIVSTCFASFIVDDKLELGIETDQDFRKKGYSMYPAAALVKYCLARGYEPIWACRKENIASFRLAQKLGFLPSSSHPYYCIPSK